MAKKRIPGLYKRSGIWHIDKQIFGKRICESTGTDLLEEAETYLAKLIDTQRSANIYGVRPERNFMQAAIKYLQENQHKSSIDDDASHLNLLNKYVGEMALNNVNSDTLRGFIDARQNQGRKTKTINLALGVVRRILNLAANEWFDENGLTWLHHAPKVKMLPVRDARQPYPITWKEQDKLFNLLPLHLSEMALFKVNTGCREQEVCQLKWEWEIVIPELNTSIFVIPAWINRGTESHPIMQQLVKNGKIRYVILNRIALAVINRVRGQDPDYVFTYEYNRTQGLRRPVTCMNNTAWQKARNIAELNCVRVHDLKHTFGCRLRQAGVNAEDRADLLGHTGDKHKNITLHYSLAQLENLVNAANKVCDTSLENKNVIMLNRHVERILDKQQHGFTLGPAKVPQGKEMKKGECQSAL